MDKMEIKPEQLDRIKELMNFNPIKESCKNNYGSEVVEYKKLASDNKTYAIVREGKKYYVKVSNKTSDILKEDFDFLGGFTNKAQHEYNSFNKALRNLELKIRSVNEACDKSDSKFEIHNADRSIEYLNEDKSQMSKEIKRQRELMFNVVNSEKKSIKESYGQIDYDVLAGEDDDFGVKGWGGKMNEEEVEAEPETTEEVAKSKTYKVTEDQMSEIKESYGQIDYDALAGEDDDFGIKGWGGKMNEDDEVETEVEPEDETETPEETEEVEFKIDGVCGNGECFVQFSEDGDSAKLKKLDVVSDWLPIDFVEDEEGNMVLGIQNEGETIKISEIIPHQVYDNFYDEDTDGEEEFEIEEDELVEMISEILKKKL